MHKYSHLLLFVIFRSGSKTAAQGGAGAKSRTNLPQPSLLRRTMCQAVTSPPRTCSSLFSRHCILCPSDHGSRFTRYLLAILCSRQEVREARNTSSHTSIPVAASQASQTVNTIVQPRVSASESPKLSPRSSPSDSLATLYQATCMYDSDSGESRHSADDYLAAVTLASGFQREN